MIPYVKLFIVVIGSSKLLITPDKKGCNKEEDSCNFTEAFSYQICSLNLLAAAISHKGKFAYKLTSKSNEDCPTYALQDSNSVSCIPLTYCSHGNSTAKRGAWSTWSLTSLTNKPCMTLGSSPQITQKEQ